ncbi:hypothetical protein DAI22_01g394150 [Oryza sativa Japonica Group]|nr:hypothetical protein DAI22_01g394150 [Oryza sativa Japonica Group]
MTSRLTRRDGAHADPTRRRGHSPPNWPLFPAILLLFRGIVCRAGESRRRSHLLLVQVAVFFVRITMDLLFRGSWRGHMNSKERFNSFHHICTVARDGDRQVWRVDNERFNSTTYLAMTTESAIRPTSQQLILMHRDQNMFTLLLIINLFEFW